MKQVFEKLQRKVKEEFKGKEVLSSLSFFWYDNRVYLGKRRKEQYMRVNDMEKLVAFAKNQGFVYPGSDIYGGLANTWDYGPTGVELLRNIKELWWKKFIRENRHNVGLDSSIIVNSRTWEASGHLGGFSDPLMDCRVCKARHRADKLIEASGEDIIADGWTEEQMKTYIMEHNIVCPSCGALDYTDIRQFELMYKTQQGVVEDESSSVYLRPETAQGIFLDYKLIMQTQRVSIPFGIGQIGKSFRNEITPGNYIFRTREFEQMELEFFVEPGTEKEWFTYWVNQCESFVKLVGFTNEDYRIREHSDDELSHYSNGTVDIEYKFPFGWGELWGIASRTDFDLSAHQRVSGVNLEYRNPQTNERYIPYVIEPSVGANRLMLAILNNAYEIETLENGETREVMRLHKALAPVKVAVLPLQKQLTKKAEEVYQQLSSSFATDFDEKGNIGKRYRRQDAIGTPFCVTVDFDTLDDGCVTVRDRDTMEQVRMPITDIRAYIEKEIQV